MKARILIDSQIVVKSGTIVDIDEKQFEILSRLHRAELADKEPKKETTMKSEPKKETRKAKK